jgi:hypothetical protein
MEMKTISLKGTYVNASPKGAKFLIKLGYPSYHSQIVTVAESFKVKIMPRKKTLGFDKGIQTKART